MQPINPADHLGERVYFRKHPFDSTLYSGQIDCIQGSRVVLQEIGCQRLDPGDARWESISNLTVPAGARLYLNDHVPSSSRKRHE